MKNKELGIYIHIPFCKHKCYYCDFVSFSSKEEIVEKYIKTVIKELKKYLENKEFMKNYNVTTIYIGGGTPSYIDSKYIEEILKEIEKNLVNNDTKFQDIEVTLEVNPGTINEEKVNLYKEAKINRISMGLQSTNDQILKQIGRIHTYNEFLDAYSIVKKAGFDNINIDLMIGLPNQTISDVKESLNKIIELNPNHISVYSLILEEGTVLDKLIEEGKMELLDEELERSMYWYVKNTLEINGFNHYEISNFSKTGKESKHNLNCWEQKEYIGIGTSAHSYINGVRYCNKSSVEKYIENINNKDIDVNEIIKLGNGDENFLGKVEEVYEIDEIQSLEDKKREYMLLGLRKLKGIKISSFKEKYIENLIYVYHKELEKLAEEDLIRIDGDRIFLSRRGIDLANLVWEEFV